MILAGSWIESEYITIDEDGWHCADNAPKDIKDAFNEYMDMVKKETEITLKE